MTVSSSPVAAPQSATGKVQLAPGSIAKIRNPIVVAILSIVTLGIYILFWQYYVNKELADYGRARGTNELGTSPGMSTLALFPGGLIVIPALWTSVTTFQRVQAAQRMTGQTPLNGWLGFVLFIVFVPAFYGYQQSGVNSAWSGVAEGLEP
jgi:hypothetical protein